MRDISIFGSTGSIGSSALKILLNQKDSFNVIVLTGGKNIKELARQSILLQPKYVVIADESLLIELKELLKDYEFDITIPIGLYVAGDISGDIISNDNSKSISNITVKILDPSGDVLTNINHTIVDHSFNDISLNYTLDNSGNFYASKHIGSLGLKLKLHIEQLAYYDIQIKFVIDKQDTNNYVVLGETSSYVSAVYMNLTNNNLETLNNITTVDVKKDNSTHSPVFNDFSIVGTLIE